MTKKKFTYGYDIQNYLDEALKRLKFTYSWVTFDDFDKDTEFAIEKEGRKHIFVSYSHYNDGSTERRVFEGDGDGFVKRIMWLNDTSIESSNKVIKKIRLEMPLGIEDCGWYLESYEMRKHKRGGVSTLITAGDRSAGGSKAYFIPDSFFEGTFEEFLEKYNELLPGRYNIDEEVVEMNPGLKKWLGFKK